MLHEEAQDINEIRFGLLSADDIRKMSVVEVNVSKYNSAEHTENSVYDIRMGPTDFTMICPTCGLKSRECPGHFGHIVLQVPVINPLFYDRVLKYLRCFCIQCYKMLITEDHLHLWGLMRYKKENRFAQILEKISKIKLCVACQLEQPTIQFVSTENRYYLIYETSKKESVRIVLHTEEIRKILYNISDEDIILLGFQPSSHPRNMILEVLPVIPPRARPFITTESQKHDDDLTTFLNDIVKVNNNLKALDLTETKREKYAQSLIYHIKYMMDNSKGVAKRPNNSSAMKGLTERLSRKNGLMRTNIQGKRQNVSARTVIGPDPTLKVNEIAIPPEIAEELTFPERVAEFNIDYLQQLVLNDGANSVKRGKKRYILEYALAGDRRNKFKLQIGDIVQRKFRDGDWTLVNRQPSLHRGSLLGVQVKIRPGKTIRMNLAITASLNADFDGDESNLFPPYSEQSRAELAYLSSIPNHIVSAQASKSNLTIVQDCLLGNYLMTKTNEAIPRESFFQILNAIPFDISVLTKKLETAQRVYAKYNVKIPLYSGKTLFSMLLPEDFNYYAKNVKVYNGILYEGAIQKPNLGSNHSSIIRLLVKEYDENVCISFINNVQWLAISYLMYHGFSVGIADCLTTKRDEIDLTISRSIIEAEGIEESTIDPNIREMRICMALGKARDVGMRIAKNSLRPDNRFMDTVSAGSKGDLFNIAQICGLLGQQNISGRRVSSTVGKKTRILPHFPMESMSKEQQYTSQGFIQHSFIQGLTPTEFWTHASTGRESVLDTALKTANSGYIQRRMVKVMEDLQVKYDNTVRNSVNQIVQFAYGSDGLDGSQIVIKDGDFTPYCCDVNRLADRLNLKYELENSHSPNQ